MKSKIKCDSILLYHMRHVQKKNNFESSHELMLEILKIRSNFLQVEFINHKTKVRQWRRICGLSERVKHVGKSCRFPAARP